MRLIGRRCKCGNAFSWPILIGRGLDLINMRSKLFNMNRIFFGKEKLRFYEQRKLPWKQELQRKTFLLILFFWTGLCSCQSSAGNQRRLQKPISIYSAWKSVIYTIVVTIAERSHLFPFRTQKLSSPAPKVLVGLLTGRIGRCHFLLPLSSVG